MSDSHIRLEFDYASFILEAYSGQSKSSSQLLKDVIIALTDPSFPKDKKERNRHENRKNTTPRRLINIASPFEPLGRRCFGRMALIKNKAPMTLKGDDIIEEIDNPLNKAFIEVTNYVINFNENSDPVIMVEFNNSGPRLSDIEYYFRQVCKDMKIATSIKSVLHLDTDYNQLEQSLRNVFDVTVKLKASHLAYSKDVSWFKSFSGLKADSGFKDVSMKLFFQRQKDATGMYPLNILGLDYARNILAWLKRKGSNIEHVEDLKMTYLVEGTDDVKDLDFLKNKTTSILNIPSINKTQWKQVDFKHKVGQEFNNYLTTGIPNKEEPIEFSPVGHA